MQDIQSETLAKVAQLPKYTCHKVVSAGRILAIETVDAVWKSRAVMVVGVRDLQVEFICSGSMFARFEPSPGDYLAIYEDGYQSFSPKKAFEEGYTLKV